MASTKARALALGVLVLGTVATVSVFSANASAHQSHIDASVSCDGTVSWTASSWSNGDEGSHGDIRVSEHSDDGESRDLRQGSFNSENGYRFSGTLPWPEGADSMTISAKPYGAWGNGDTSDDGDDVIVAQPEDCEHHPEVGTVTECEDSAPGYGDGAVTFTLTNPAGPFGHDAEFDLSGPDSGSQGGTYHVASGHHETVSYHDLDDGHHRVHVKVGDKEYDEDFEINCDQSVPSVDDHEECVGGDGEITVHMSNTGGDAVEYDIEDPVTHEHETVKVEPNHTESRHFGHLHDGEYTLPVHVGDEDMSQHHTVNCDHEDDHGDKGTSSVTFEKACVDHDGRVTLALIVTGGKDAVLFTVEGVTYSVKPGVPTTAVVGGLTDGAHRIHVTAGKKDLSFDVTIGCDLSPRVTVTQECVEFDGAVNLLLENLGDDVSATFAIDGVDHVLAPGASQTVVVDGLSDGPTTITLAINGKAQPDIVVNFDCDPVFGVAAECNTISAQGDVQEYWFTITNTESTAVDVSWNGGSVTVPAGESRTVASSTAVLSLQHDGVEIASTQATNVVCTRSVTVEKQVIGTPASPETYTVSISRRVGDTFVPAVSFDLVAGQSKSVALPSTLDPIGIGYKVEETGRGSASSSVITPGTLTLSGHLGQTVSVVVVNAYDQSVTTSSVAQGGPVPPAPPTTPTTATTDPPAGPTTTIVQVLPPPPSLTPTPTTTPTTVSTRPLPVSGGSPLPLLFIGFGLACMGGAMVLTRRRVSRN
jgi:hypothetical protein